MQINVRMDKNIQGGEDLIQYVSSTLTEDLRRFENAITTLEVFLSDENAAKVGGKKCLIEARIAHHQPVVASHETDNLHQAISGASEKIFRVIDTMVQKLSNKNESARQEYVEENFSSDED